MQHIQLPPRTNFSHIVSPPEENLETRSIIFSVRGSGNDKELSAITIWYVDTNTTEVFYRIKDHDKVTQVSNLLEAIAVYNQT